MITEAMLNLLSPLNALGRLENPAYSLNNPETWSDLFNEGSSAAGIPISHMKALTDDAVWQAVTLISGDASCALLNVQKRGNGKRNTFWAVDTTHKANRLVSLQANDETSSVDYRRRLFAHALLWGNGYAWIERNPAGQPKALINLLPDRTIPKRDANGDLFYITEVGEGTQAKPEALLANDVIHLKGLSLHNALGVDLITKARNAIGLSLAAVDFSSKFFSQGAQSGGILEIPPHFSQEAKDNLQEGWDKKGGKDSWFKTIILREGAKFHKLTIDARSSQLNQLREDQVRAIARFFNLPPFKLGLTDSVSYNSAEQLQLIYLQGTLLHWLVAERAEYDLKLLTDPQKQRSTHRFAHDVSPLIELDAKTLNEVLQLQRQNLIITTNEWRNRVNYAPSEDPIADKLLNPNTLSNSEESDDDTSDNGQTNESNTNDSFTEDDEREQENQRRLIAAHKNLLIHTSGICARRLVHDANRLAKNPKKFMEWIDWAMKPNRELFHSAFQPVVEVLECHDFTITKSLLPALEAMFFGDIQHHLNQFCSAPYHQAELQKNVFERMSLFPEEVAASIASLLDSYTLHESIQENSDAQAT